MGMNYVNALAVCCLTLTILLSFLYFHWLFPLLARQTCGTVLLIYKSTRERVDSKGLYGRWRLYLMAFSGKMKSLEIPCLTPWYLLSPSDFFTPSLLTKPLVTRMTSLEKRACQQNTTWRRRKTVM